MTAPFDPANSAQVAYIRACLTDPWPYAWAEVAKALGCEATREAVREALAAREAARPINPECVAEKCRNCDGTALDEAADEIVQCEHGCHAFERIDEQAEREWWA